MVLFWRQASVNLGILTPTTNPALKPERGRLVLAKGVTVLGGPKQRGRILAAPSLAWGRGWWGYSSVWCPCQRSHSAAPGLARAGDAACPDQTVIGDFGSQGA